MTRSARIVLVQEIWDTIAPESTPPLSTESHGEELQRSAEDDDADPENVVPWEQVKASTRARLQSWSPL